MRRAPGATAVAQEVYGREHTERVITAALADYDARFRGAPEDAAP
ncbi:MAG TPA: hypothetical protein VGR37_13515 [Longimicrobiaceae bacterium]|nr:hypothetical protein [Longimicrobiaceae bacterium]